ncbi:2TM domain-containing protein [Georgenia muralis]|uniref:2TM domain-containing protein n=1 Tax=Georgenia muralis TaxID=154117 RepID=A0A3N4Z4M2_9MICO|nr:2TM domain-containing protein [Georgenia muralis]RPF26844.1 2TM domain-containing protein [Georgenia muralis]
MTQYTPGQYTSGAADPVPDEAELRRLAIKRLKDKRDFRAHLLAYVSVNLLLVVIWWMTGAAAFFWPVFPILGWGIGLLFHAMDVYSPPPGPAEIAAEMDRLRQQR